MTIIVTLVGVNPPEQIWPEIIFETLLLKPKNGLVSIEVIVTVFPRVKTGNPIFLSVVDI